ncbi:hypothetical protein BaRGS_00035367 [Batillaria attramentaria]|uniref:Uncharacterized protein n=1 Tax=Batillaria attramentaria TaxID=370345 RepID=A0ABD0JEB1_9CAEN
MTIVFCKLSCRKLDASVSQESTTRHSDKRHPPSPYLRHLSHPALLNKQTQDDRDREKEVHVYALIVLEKNPASC